MQAVNTFPNITYNPSFKKYSVAVLVATVLLLGACKPADTVANAEAAPLASEQTVATTAKPGLAADPAPVKKAAEPAPVCSTCGTVRAITPITVEGQSTGVGAAIGAVAGGLAGSQIGGGNGKKIATVAGVVGGALAGNKIEQKRNSSQSYDITIALDNGSVTTINVPDASGIAVGSKVAVENGNISLR